MKNLADLNPAPTRLISREQASKLLDSVLYERVLEYVDIEGLVRLEEQLWVTLLELGVADAAGTASGLVGEALGRMLGDSSLWESFSTTAATPSAGGGS